MSSSRIPLLIVPLALLCGAAHAAKAGAFGTREQLRDCLARDDAMKARLRAIEAATEAHDRNFDANEAEGADLVKMKATLDRADKAAIATFNKAVLEHNLHIRQANQEASNAELAASAYASDKAALDDRCGGLTYRPADMEAVARERTKAASAP